MGDALDSGDSGRTGGSGDLIRRAEQLRVDVTRGASERVLLTRRIISETRMVPVQVRREVLEVERSPVASDFSGTRPSDVVAEPLEIILHEEVPVFTFEVRPVERVRVSIQEVAGDTVIREQVATEQVEVLNIPPPAPRV